MVFDNFQEVEKICAKCNSYDWHLKVISVNFDTFRFSVNNLLSFVT